MNQAGVVLEKRTGLVREHQARMEGEALRVRDEFSGDEAAEYKRGMRATQSELEQAEQQQWTACERRVEAIGADISDFAEFLPAYEALTALQREAPGEFRAWRDARVHAILGAHRMNRVFTVAKQTREILIAGAPEEFEAWAAAGEALKKYNGATLYVADPPHEAGAEHEIARPALR